MPGSGRKTAADYWKEAITALRPEVVVPKSKNARMELLAQLILDIDLEPFVPRGRGFLKQCLSPKALKEAAQVWCQYHPMSTRDDLQNLRQTLPYPVLWQHLKRRVLKECGLFVVTAASRRVYFEVPHERPWLAPAKHANVKEGQWRERVIVPGPYGQEPGDDDMQEDLDRERMYVRSAAYEQAMGRGGTPEEEVPLPFDDEALDCPDSVTKAEWDALWPYEDLVRPEPLVDPDLPVPSIPDGDERLSWVLPERDGGCCEAAFDRAMRDHAAPPSEEPGRSG